MKCPKCQFKNPAGIQFCSKCGEKLEYICSQCHFSNPPDFAFCGKCGSPIEPDAKMPSNKPERAPLPSTKPKDTPINRITPLHGERKHATVLFSDLTGYTTLSEKLDPEKIKDIMGYIFTEAGKIAEKYDATVEKFFGDEIMILLGAPKAHEDDPVRAINVALEIHKRVKAISSEYEKETGVPLVMHTGINTGLVVTGDKYIGKSRHGLTGDTINLAKRLTSMAESGEIVVGPDTYNQSVGFFDFESLGPTKVKGKKKPVSIYKLKSSKKESFKTHRLQGMQAALTGRDEEMTVLTKAAERLKHGRGSIISISGDAGTGKSRLKKELKDTLDLKKIEWREGHAYGYTRGVPYYPLINLLTHAFQIEESDTAEKIRTKVETGVSFLLDENKQFIPYIGSLFSLTYPEIEDVNPEFWKDKLQESVQALLLALVDKTQTVICFEDLHWADPSFIELFKKLAIKTHEKSLFIVTYRSHFTLFDSDLPDALVDNYKDIRLKELASLDAQEMLKSLLETQKLPEDVYEIVQNKAEGNPFFIEEIINSLIDSHVLTRHSEYWKLNRKITENDIPATLHGLLTARVDRLGQHFKRVLQEASVIGRAFLYRILEHITDTKRDVDDYLPELENLDLVRIQSFEPELEYIFKHALTQEVVYNGLLKKERQEIHERIGLAIEQLFINRLPEFYEALAFHFSLGRSPFKAVDYLMKAAEKSLKRYALEESHQYYSEAFELLSNNSARGRKGDELLIDLIIDWALVFYYRGDSKQLAPLLKSHEEFTVALGDQRRLGLIYAWTGYVMFWRENYKESHAYLKKALSIGEKLNSNTVIGYACAWLPFTCAELGLFNEGIDYGNKVQEIAQTFELDKYVQFKSLSGIGYIQYFRGMKRGLLQVVEVVKHGMKNYDPRFTGMVMIGYGLAHLLDGNFPLAVEHCRKAVQVSSDPIYSMVFRTMLGFSYLAEGNFKNARDEAEKVVEFSRDSGVHWLGTMARLILSIVTIVEGQISKGMKELKKIIHASSQNESRWLQAQAEYMLGVVYSQMAMGSAPINLFIILNNLLFLIKDAPFAFKKAEHHLTEAVKAAKKIGAKGIIGQAYFHLGLLYKKKKRYDKAEQFISNAIQVFEESNAEIFLVEARQAIKSLELKST